MFAQVARWSHRWLSAAPTVLCRHTSSNVARHKKCEAHIWPSGWCCDYRSRRAAARRLVESRTSGVQGIRVVIVDDHAMVRSGLRLLLESAMDLVVVAEASNRAETFALVGSMRP